MQCRSKGTGRTDIYPDQPTERGSKPHKCGATTSRSIKLGEDNYLPLRLYQGLKRTLFVKELVNCQVIIKNYLYHHLGEIYSAEETEKLSI